MTTIPGTQGYGSSSQSASTKPLDIDPVGKFKEFMEAAKKGPGEFWRAQFLASKGLSEEDVAAMSQEEREKLEQEIKDFIEAKVEEKQAQIEKKTLPVQTMSDEALGHMVLSSMQNNAAVSHQSTNDQQSEEAFMTHDEKERADGFL
ncbi:MAG: hypothetical protein AB7E85_06495 [Pseudobdellovibrionaceae bacterium]